MKKILFICTGNTCRSPMAEALLNEKGKGRFKAKSAGVFAGKGQALSPGAADILKEKNVPFNHQSKPLDEHLVDWADTVLTMTENHKRLVYQYFPHVQEKVYTLKEYTINPTDNTIWKQLQQCYAELETKRAAFLGAQQDGCSEDELQEALNRHLKDEIQQTEALECQLPSLDITDPYGASVEMYRVTCEEIEEQIDELIRQNLQG
jgi:protein-tyrosine-phosphatase